MYGLNTRLLHVLDGFLSLCSSGRVKNTPDIIYLLQKQKKKLLEMEVSSARSSFSVQFKKNDYMLRHGH